MDYKKRENFYTVKEVVEHNTSKDILKEEKRDYQFDFGGIPDMIRDHSGKISIISDYDVDGVCCSLILDMILVFLQKDFEVYVPRRETDGYGLSEKILDKVSGTLIITVDNGIVAFDAVKKAKEQGRSVIILDHHLPARDTDGEIIYPEADHIIDLEADAGVADSDHYCGAGVAYKLLCEMIPDETIQNHALAYAAIATIADVMPLRKDNRKIVKNGLEVLNHMDLLPPALKELLYKNYANNVTESDIGFKIAPTINAMGRLYNDGGQVCYQILKMQSNLTPWIEHMIAVNKQRQLITKEKTKIAKEIIDEMDHIPSCIVLYLEGIPEGVVGLIAGKLTEEYGVPSIVLTDTANSDLIKGSGRNDLDNMNLKKVLDDCSDLLVKYGGHEAAAGLSLKKTNLKVFQKAMEKAVEPYVNDHVTEKYYDLEIEDLEDLPYYYKELRKYAPYGNGNPEPIFYIPNYSILPTPAGFYETFGAEEEHIRFSGYNGKVVGFYFTDKYKEEGEPKKIDMIGTIGEKVFYFHHKKQTFLQIQMDDFWKSKNVIPKTHLAMKIKNMAENRER